MLTTCYPLNWPLIFYLHLWKSGSETRRWLVGPCPEDDVKPWIYIYIYIYKWAGGPCSQFKISLTFRLYLSQASSEVAASETPAWKISSPLTFQSSCSIVNYEE